MNGTTEIKEEHHILRLIPFFGKPWNEDGGKKHLLVYVFGNHVHCSVDSLTTNESLIGLQKIFLTRRVCILREITSNYSIACKNKKANRRKKRMKIIRGYISHHNNLITFKLSICVLGFEIFEEAQLANAWW